MINLDGGELAKTMQMFEDENSKELTLTYNEIELIKAFEYEIQRVQDVEGVIISAFYDGNKTEENRIQITIITTNDDNTDYRVISKLADRYKIQAKRINFDLWFLEYLQNNQFRSSKISNGKILNSGYIVFDRNGKLELIKNYLVNIPKQPNTLTITNINEVKPANPRIYRRDNI